MGRIGKATGRLLLLAVATGVLVAGVFLPYVAGLGAAARANIKYFNSLPTKLCNPTLAQTSQLLDDKGQVIARFYKENRRVVPLSEVPAVMQHALIAIEDVRFYAEGGVNVKSVLRAAVTDTRTGAIRQGGSTLTQQYVKNVLEACGDKTATADTLRRKLREAALAIHLANTESKSKILQGYLNIVDFGDGAYGVGAAARHYFGEPVTKLDLPQSALLAGLVQAPSAYDPVVHPKAASARRNVVLAQMAKYHFISKQRYLQAVRRKLELHVRHLTNGCDGSSYPWFCDYVSTIVSNRFGTNRLYQGGLRIRTSLDPKVAKAAREAVRHYVPARTRNGVAAAEAVVEPGTGKVLAIAVSKHYGQRAKRGESSIDYAVRRSVGGSGDGVTVGSTAKLFTLAAAIKRGLPLSTTINSPYKVTVKGFQTCAGDKLQPYKLHSAGQSDAGSYNIVTATWYSINTFFAQLEHRVGLCRVIHTAERMGLRQADGKPLVEIPSFVLGAQPHGLTPLGMAEAYATVAAHGRYCSPTAITSIETAQGKSLKVPEPYCHRALPRHVADTVTGILRGVLTRPGATAANVGTPGRPAAGKTGTADNDSVSNFAGFVPQLASFVWVGYPATPNRTLDRVTLGHTHYGIVYGATIAGPIWRRTFERALRGTPQQAMPPAIGNPHAPPPAPAPVTVGPPAPPSTGSPGHPPSPHKSPPSHPRPSRHKG